MVSALILIMHAWVPPPPPPPPPPFLSGNSTCTRAAASAGFTLHPGAPHPPAGSIFCEVDRKREREREREREAQEVRVGVENHERRARKRTGSKAHNESKTLLPRRLARYRCDALNALRRVYFATARGHPLMWRKPAAGKASSFR